MPRDHGQRRGGEADRASASGRRGRARDGAHAGASRAPRLRLCRRRRRVGSPRRRGRGGAAPSRAAAISAEHDRGDDRVGDAREVARDVVLELALEDLGLVDERRARSSAGAGTAGAGIARVLGQVDRQAEQRRRRGGARISVFQVPCDGQRLGRLVDARARSRSRCSRCSFSPPCQAIALTQYGVVGRVGRVDARRSRRRCAPGPESTSVRVTSPRSAVGARVADVERDDGGDRAPRRARPGRSTAGGADASRRRPGALGGGERARRGRRRRARRRSPVDQRGQQRVGDQALAATGPASRRATRRTRRRSRRCRSARPRRRRTRRGAVVEIDERQQLDAERLGEVEREVRRRLAEHRADDQRDACRGRR